MPERFLVGIAPSAHILTEVEVDHWFRRAGRRFAVVFRLHCGYQPLFYVVEEFQLHPIPADHVSEWEDTRDQHPEP